MKDKSNAANLETRLSKDLKNIIIVEILKSTKEKKWVKILQDAKESLKKLHPDQRAIQIIGKIVKILQQRSRKDEYLKSKAYSWLRSLVYNPPKSAWFPDKAIDVAYAVFRLKGKVECFKNYMLHHSRVKVLEFFIKDKRAFA